MLYARRLIPMPRAQDPSTALFAINSNGLSRFAIWACLGRLNRQNAANDKLIHRQHSKSADCSLRLPRIMLKEASYDGDTWPNPRHKLHRRAFRWPALRAVGELPRSNRIGSRDQIKPMLFWRMGLAQPGTSGKGGSSATWECGSGRAAVVLRTRHSGRTLHVHALLSTGEGFCQKHSTLSAHLWCRVA